MRFVLITLLVICSSACSSQRLTERVYSTVPETLFLSEANTVVLRGEINQGTAEDVIKNILEKDKALPSGKPLHLVLDTPGGDIDAGEKIIAVCLKLHREVRTVTIRAASMGFFIVQALGDRMLTLDGELMSHPPAVVFSSRQFPRPQIPQAINDLNDALNSFRPIEKRTADRMGLTLEKYYELANKVYIVKGPKALRDNAADALVLVKCSDDLINAKDFFVEMTDKGLEVFAISHCPSFPEHQKANF